LKHSSSPSFVLEFSTAIQAVKPFSSSGSVTGGVAGEFYFHPGEKKAIQR
jgi:hypothetical protein